MLAAQEGGARAPGVDVGLERRVAGEGVGVVKVEVVVGVMVAEEVVEGHA